MADYGSKKYQAIVPPVWDKFVDASLVPQMQKAVAKAENNPNMGVLSVKTNDPVKVLQNSIYNNFARWYQAGQPGKFVDFMQKRWAPLGVANDPKNLNANWAPNVRKFLKKQLGQETYDKWRGANLVMLPDQTPWQQQVTG